ARADPRKSRGRGARRLAFVIRRPCCWSRQRSPARARSCCSPFPRRIESRRTRSRRFRRGSARRPAPSLACTWSPGPVPGPRKEVGLRREIEGDLAADYHSRLVDGVRAGGYRLSVRDLTFRLAKDFGFCSGVDRAVEYAYEAHEKFPSKRLFLVGEIIHNPHVNRRLEEKGITILSREGSGEFAFSGISPEDVVILHAFGVTVHDF